MYTISTNEAPPPAEPNLPLLPQEIISPPSDHPTEPSTTTVVTSEPVADTQTRRSDRSRRAPQYLNDYEQ